MFFIGDFYANPSYPPLIRGGKAYGKSPPDKGDLGVASHERIKKSPGLRPPPLKRGTIYEVAIKLCVHVLIIYLYCCMLGLLFLGCSVYH